MSAFEIHLSAGDGQPWFLGTVAVGEDVTLDAMFNPLWPISTINKHAVAEIKSKDPDNLQRIGDRRLRLCHLKVEGRVVPDLVVREAPFMRFLTSLSGAQLIVGYNFFSPYSKICFDPGTAIITID